MKIENKFVVQAPIDQVWATMMDVERVAGCVPGARVLNQLSEDTYQVGMKVRLGPMIMQYRGQITVAERDEASRRAVMQGKAKETRGQGTAEATVELRLAEDDEGTRGTVQADVRLSGKAAAMGQAVIGDVANQMVGQFVGNLEQLLASPAVDERSGETVAEAVETASAGSSHGGVQRPPQAATSGDAPVERVEDDREMTEGQVATGPGSPGGGAAAAPSTAGVSGGKQSQSGARTSDRFSADAERRPAPSWSDEEEDDGGGASLDGLALAKGVLVSRLADPRVVLGLLVVVALLAFRRGRRGRPHISLRDDDLERIASFLDRR